MSLLLDKNGKPLASDAMKEEMRSRGEENYKAMIALVGSRNITLDECADLLANLFGFWCSKSPYAYMMEKVPLVVNAMVASAAKMEPAKLAEAKIAKSLMDNSGSAEKQ